VPVRKLAGAIQQKIPFIPESCVEMPDCTQSALKREQENPEPLENTGVPGFDFVV